MNKLFLIGNGFDLAHGLKTKYSDFILGYFNKVILKAASNIYEDDLVKYDTEGYRRISSVVSLADLNSFLTNRNMKVKCKHTFLKNILDRLNDTNWVNIEFDYYMHLLTIYQSVEKHRLNEDFHKEAKQINKCLESIKNELVDYLKTQRASSKNDTIAKHFRDELATFSPISHALVLVFNYTDTMALYKDLFTEKQNQIVHIHGKLNDEKNPVIFGYGDEMDPFYPRIEQLNSNEFLRNMKSFSYFKTDNYQNLHNFLNKDLFDVCIMGHSCGISDRVLLSSIFCHKNCRYIRIYYYKNEDGETDYFEKTQEISRHFPLDKKDRMRSMIVSFQNSEPLS